MAMMERDLAQAHSDPIARMRRGAVDIIMALSRAHVTVLGLHHLPLEEVRINQFNESALPADIEAERAVLESLRDFRIPVRVLSEEHGIVDLFPDPKYFGVLDGIDGSAVYRKERETGRYATLFAMYDGVDPFYADYLACGAMEHGTERTFLQAKAEEDSHSFVVDYILYTQSEAPRLVLCAP